MSLPVVAIVGRPNVGKSTLFNRLVGFPKAAVHDRPGVTRDRIYEEAEALGIKYLCIDTGGLEPVPETPLLEAMRLQSMVAVEEADVIVLLVDGPAGTTPADQEVADILRRSEKPVVLAVNKIDGQKHDDLVHDFYGLGIDPLIPISAAHSRGVYELIEAIFERFPEKAPQEEEDEAEEDFDPDAPYDPDKGEIRVAVIGRPNIGKSTLVNRLVGEDRHLVHDMPGTTMDPIDSAFTHNGRDYLFVDTAGVRRKSRVEDQLERFISLRSIKSIERCHIALLVIDATEGVTDQDQRLAQLVISRGRGLMILVNKWDLTKDDPEITAKGFEDQFQREFPHAPWAPYLFISAKTGKGTGRILEALNDIWKSFNRRITTSELNRFLELAVVAHSPPQKHHHPVRLYYASQVRVRPPTFAFFSNSPDGIPAAYERYLNNRLRDNYSFKGSPLRLNFRRRRKIGEDRD